LKIFESKVEMRISLFNRKEQQEVVYTRMKGKLVIFKVKTKALKVKK
jgi:hypothetical protein